jgi:hypothetical protein
MKSDFPQYSKNAKLGEFGVGIVSKIISDSFGWIFKRNHQEHDFGIDGQIEIVTDDGLVTGQIFAIQIKCGESFLNEKSKFGYVYRGERKHFNYLINYPIPVIIAICDPGSQECYWTLFRPEETLPTEVSWKITIPFCNKLNTSKAELISLVTPVRDGFAELQEYWKFNKMIAESSVILYVLDESDVDSQDTNNTRIFFDRLKITKEMAAQCQGKVEIMFSGYDDDSREIYEIKEIRDYISKLDSILPDLFFFVRSEPPAFTLSTFALCQTTFEFVGDISKSAKVKHLSVDPRPIAHFIARHCPALNQLTQWLDMPREDEKKLFFSIVKCLGLELPDNIVNK